MLDIILISLLSVLAVMTWQHVRYLRIRRNLAQDRQRPLHPVETFHVIVLFKLKSGDKVVETARRFMQQLSFGSPQLIYAGQAAFTVNAVHVGNRDWDGVLLIEFPSRPHYEMCRVDPRTVLARQVFSDSYLHGMRRNRRLSLMFPQLLLRCRLRDILRGRWRAEPLQRSLLFETAPEFQLWRSRVDRLLSMHQINREGMVVFNLIKYDSAGYQDAEQIYGSKLLSRMAALRYGPLHIGRSVALEELARFDQIYIVYYPSARYFADLLASQYFPNIAGSKLMGDSFRVITAPITAQLE